MDLANLWETAAYGSIAGLGVSYFTLNGNNGAITTTFEPVWPESAAYTFLAANMSTPYIASSSANDTSAGTGARTVTIYGVDANFAAQTETLSLNGQTSVNLVNSYMSINRMEVITAGAGGSNAGTIRIGTGANAAGVPAVVHGHVAIGFNQSQSAIYTVPASKSLIMRNLTMSSKGVTAAQTVEFIIDRFVNGGIVKREEVAVLNQGGCSSQTVPTMRIFAAKTQFMIQALSAASTGPAYVDIECLLIDLPTVNPRQTIFQVWLMTILDMARTCATRLQLSSPSTFIGSTDNNMILLRAMLEEACSKVGSEYPWVELEKEYTFTLATSTDSYALPGDFDRIQNQTLWNRTQKWPLIGPLDAIQWQTYKSGLISTVPRQRFRVKGWTNNQFFVDPTPSSSENGQTCVYEYISKTTIKPGLVWVALEGFTGIRYCSYNGNIYDRGGTGAATAGTSAPVHTSGTVSDGSISWTYLNSPFETFTYDSDQVILDNQMIIDRAVWRFKQERGFDFEDMRAQADAQLEINKTKLSGANVISVIGDGAGYPPILGINNYPQGNF